MSSPLRSQDTELYVQDTEFLTFLITNTSSDQFGTYPFAKKFLSFDILTISPILNLGSLSLISFIELIYVFHFTSKGFVLIVL